MSCRNSLFWITLYHICDLQIFSPIPKVAFHCVNSFLCTKSFSLIPLLYFPFGDCSCWKKSLPRPLSKSFSFMFFLLRVLKFQSLMVKSLIHFGLISVYSSKSCCAQPQKHFFRIVQNCIRVQFHSLHMNIYYPNTGYRKINLFWLWYFGIIYQRSADYIWLISQ